MKTVTATLVVQVTFKLPDGDSSWLHDHLNGVVEYANNRGLITGDTALEVEDMVWEAVVGRVIDTDTDEEGEE